MKEFKFLLLWHAYAFTYIAIFYLLFMNIPEDWLFEVTKIFHHGRIGHEEWDETYMSILMLTALALNATLILLMELWRHRGGFRPPYFIKRSSS